MFFGSRDSREEGEIPSFEEHHQEPANQIEDEDLARIAEDCATFAKFYAAKSGKGKDILRKNGFEYIFDKPCKTEEGTIFLIICSYAVF